jgi:DNA repair exonuclease SbcCD ATPase subunit
LESDENKKTTIEYQRPIMNGNHQKSLLLVHVLWATLLLISIITVRSIYIDQVLDADQNLEKLLAFKKNNNLLEEQLETMHIEKNQLESKFQGLEQSMNDQLMKQKELEAALSLENSQSTNMNDQLMKQKELEAALSLEKSQATKQTKSEVKVFKPDQNNCCFCSCGTRAFEESLQNSR